MAQKDTTQYVVKNKDQAFADLQQETDALLADLKATDDEAEKLLNALETQISEEESHMKVAQQILDTAFSDMQKTLENTENESSSLTE